MCVLHIIKGKNVFEDKMNEGCLKKGMVMSRIMGCCGDSPENQSFKCCHLVINQTVSILRKINLT